MSGTPTITAADLKKASRPDYIGMLMQQLKGNGAGPLVEMEREFRFHKTRRWRVDLRIKWHSPFGVADLVCVECEGGQFIQGRHTRGAGSEKDMEKYAELVIAGYRLLRVSPRQIKNGQAAGWIRRLLEA